MSHRAFDRAKLAPLVRKTRTFGHAAGDIACRTTSAIAIAMVAALTMVSSASAEEAPNVYSEATMHGARLYVQEVNCVNQPGGAGRSRAAEPGIIEVTWTANGVARRATMSPCSHRRTRWRGRGWRVELIGAPKLDWPMLRLTLDARRPASYRFRYAIDVAGERVEAGSVRSRVRWYKATRVWQGEDRFINYCIRETRPLLSSGGRLFCNVPGFADVGTRIVPD